MSELDLLWTYLLSSLQWIPHGLGVELLFSSV